MKKLYVLFMVLILGTLLSACSASTANIQSAELGKGYDSGTNKVTGATTTFDKADPEIHIVTAVANVPDGTTVRAVLIAADVTDMNGTAAKDTKMNEFTKTLPSDATIDFKFTVPSVGEWPVGKFKVEIYLNDKLDRTLEFTVQ